MTSVDFPQSAVWAGVARGDITPPVGIYHRMWGAATHDRSTGVHRPLTATVLCLAPSGAGDEAGGPMAFIAVDHCLLWTTDIQRLLDAVAAQGSMERERLTIFFSHTHAAGLMDPQRAHLPGGDLIAGYLSQMAETLVTLVTQARSAMRPADIVYGYGHCDLATNRDYDDQRRGQYVCGFNPDGPADDRLLVARVSATDGAALATIVNYACHPTTLAWQNTLISPDYIGAMREVVEEAISAPCLFIQGASGDIGPREGYVGDTAVADRNGRRLGYAALSALEALAPPGKQFRYAGAVVSGATLGTWEWSDMSDARRRTLACWRPFAKTVQLPYREDLGDPAALQAAREQWEAEFRFADEAGDLERARDARAMAERATREITRVSELPPGSTYPYLLRGWRIGDAVWVALDGEHFNTLQRSLRDRFPGVPIVIGTLANGSNVWYVPDRDSFGKGLYQEEASILARGALETLIEEFGSQIAAVLAS
jgi:hypothetical protein